MDFSEAWDHAATTVALACRLGNNEALTKLLESGKDVDGQDNRGWRPVHEAAAGNHLQCLEILLKRNDSDLSWSSFEGETPLLLALINGNEKAVSMLLKAGADPKTSNNENQTALHYSTRKNLHDSTALLLQSDVWIDAPDFTGETALHVAADNGFADMVRLLLNNEASILAADDLGRTALFLAAEKGHLSCISLIAEAMKSRGLEILIEMGPPDGTTPIMIAAQNGFPQCVQLLIDNKADVNKFAKDKSSAIHLAIHMGHVECVKILFYEMDVTIREAKCEPKLSGKCLLHQTLFALKSQVEILRVILEGGINPNICYQVLHWSEHQKLPLIYVLLDYCFEDIPQRMNFPLYYAVSNYNKHQSKSYMDIIDVLLKYGANPNHPLNLYPKKFPHTVEKAAENSTVLIKLIQFGADYENYFRHASRSSRRFKSLDLLNERLMKGSKTFPLQHLCRRVILDAVRQKMQWAPGLKDVLAKLPLPHTMVQYLLFNDL